MKKLLFLASLLLSMSAKSQVGIGTITPSAKSELEVASDTSGVLIPRITSVEMNNIGLPGSPADGLLIYNTDFKRFYFYTTTNGWSPCNFNYRTMIADADGDTKVEVEQSADEDIVHFTAGGNEILQVTATGVDVVDENYSYKIDGATVLAKKNNNVFAGNGGASTTTGDNNVAIGNQALDNINTGDNNVAIGTNAGKNITSASNSLFIGNNAGYDAGAGALQGDGNIAIGAGAGTKLEGTANKNTIIGYNAAVNVSTSDNSIFIGYGAGSTVETSDSNIVIGVLDTVPSKAVNGQCNIANVIGSDSIYSPRGNVKFANSYTFPDTTGEAGMTLVMGSNGELEWNDKNVAGESSMTVTGAATNLQPYNKIVSSGDGTTNGNLFFMPVTAMATGEISRISSYIDDTPAGTELHLGLYTASYSGSNTILTVAEASGNKFKSYININNANDGSMVTLDFYDLFSEAFSVTVGEQYFIGVWAKNSSANSVKLLSRTDNEIKAFVVNGYTGPTLPDSRTFVSNSANEKLLWVRAH